MFYKGHLSALRLTISTPFEENVVESPRSRVWNTTTGSDGTAYSLCHIPDNARLHAVVGLRRQGILGRASVDCPQTPRKCRLGTTKVAR